MKSKLSVALSKRISGNSRFIRTEVLQWPQEKVADRMGCEQGYIGKIEGAKLTITLENLMKLAYALTVHYHVLIDKDLMAMEKETAQKEVFFSQAQRSVEDSKQDAVREAMMEELPEEKKITIREINAAKKDRAHVPIFMRPVLLCHLIV